MDLRDDGEPVAAVEALDDPHLPERLRAIELLRDDATGEALQLLVVARPGQARVPDVVVDVEVLVIDPRRMAIDGHVEEDLAIAWDQMKPRRDVFADAGDVDATVGGAKRARVVGRGAPDVHVVGRLSAIRNELSKNPSRS
jgi:hypothetical protein